DASLRRDAVNWNVVGCSRNPIGSGRETSITGAIGGYVSAVPEIIAHADRSGSEIKIVNNFLVSVQCGDARRCSILRRSRITAKHFVGPVDPGIDHSNVDAVALNAAG